MNIFLTGNKKIDKVCRATVFFFIRGAKGSNTSRICFVGYENTCMNLGIYEVDSAYVYTNTCEYYPGK